MSISLLSGWFVPLVIGVALVTLGIALARSAPRALWWIGAAALAGWFSIVVLKALIGSWPELQPTPPLHDQLWAAFAFFALYAVIAGWRSASRRQRWLGPVAVCISLVAVLAVINSDYAYYPTLASVFSDQSAKVSLRELRSKGYIHEHRAEVDKAVAQDIGPNGSTTPALIEPIGPAHPSGGTAPTPTAGRVVAAPIPGTVSGFKARTALVYLPPAWFRANRPRLPVVVLVPGTPGWAHQWTQVAQVDRVADAWAKVHGGMAPILAMVDENGSYNGDSECVDRAGLHPETYLTVDVPNTITKLFDASPNPQQWAIEGLSEGGTCAMTVALRHPDRYGAFVDIAGELAPSIGSPARNLKQLFGGSQATANSYNPSLLLEQRKYAGLGAWFEVGKNDSHYRVLNERLAMLATASGADTHLMMPPGGHSFRIVRSSFSDSLPWLWLRFGAPTS